MQTFNGVQKACLSCGSGSYCNFTAGFTSVNCAPCTVCGVGYQEKFACTLTANTVCQDVDECANLIAQCSPNGGCVNTIGGYNCLTCKVRLPWN